MINTAQDRSAHVVEEITTYIRSCLSSWFDAGAELASSTPDLRRYTWSFFLRYQVNRPGESPLGLLVKVPLLQGMMTLADAAAAQEMVPFTQLEYEALVNISRAFVREGTPNLCAIRPLAFLPRWNAIVMEELPSQPLKKLLLKPGMLLGLERDWRPFINAVAGAGRWLRIFHTRVGSGQLEPLNKALVKQEIDQTLRELEGTTMVPMSLDPLRQMLKQQLEQTSAVAVPVANLHTDPTCANIFTTPDGRVGVLDPGASVRAPVYKDLAVLLNDIRTRFVQVITNGRGYPAGRLEECRRAFLTGYFESSSYDEDVLALYSALAAIHKWAQDERALAESKRLRWVAPLVAPYLRRFFKSEVARYLPRAVRAVPGSNLSIIG